MSAQDQFHRIIQDAINKRQKKIAERSQEEKFAELIEQARDFAANLDQESDTIDVSSFSNCSTLLDVLSNLGFKQTSSTTFAVPSDLELQNSKKRRISEVPQPEQPPPDNRTEWWTNELEKQQQQKANSAALDENTEVIEMKIRQITAALKYLQNSY